MVLDDSFGDRKYRETAIQWTRYTYLANHRTVKYVLRDMLRFRHGQPFWGMAFFASAEGAAVALYMGNVQSGEHPDCLYCMKVSLTG